MASFRRFGGIAVMVALALLALMQTCSDSFARRAIAQALGPSPRGAEMMHRRLQDIQCVPIPCPIYFCLVIACIVIRILTCMNKATSGGRTAATGQAMVQPMIQINSQQMVQPMQAQPQAAYTAPVYAAPVQAPSLGFCGQCGSPKNGQKFCSGCGSPA